MGDRPLMSITQFNTYCWLQLETSPERSCVSEMVRLSSWIADLDTDNRSWDLGGQPRFRSMWERYCRDVQAIVYVSFSWICPGRHMLTIDRYVVDAADKEAIPIAAEELHALLSKPSVEGIPLLVLGNKSDLPEKLSVDELIDQLDLKSFVLREISCYGVSAKEETNLDAVLQWLIARTSH